VYIAHLSAAAVADNAEFSISGRLDSVALAESGQCVLFDYRCLLADYFVIFKRLSVCVLRSAQHCKDFLESRRHDEKKLSSMDGIREFVKTRFNSTLVALLPEQIEDVSNTTGENRLKGQVFYAKTKYVNKKKFRLDR
jgi:hypothetical protein